MGNRRPAYRLSVILSVAISGALSLGGPASAQPSVDFCRVLSLDPSIVARAQELVAPPS